MEKWKGLALLQGQTPGSEPGMKATKFLVLLAGILGIVSFILPMLTVKTTEGQGQFSAYRMVVGVDKATQIVAGPLGEAIDKEGGVKLKETLAEANLEFAKVKNIILGMYAPMAVLLLLGLVGMARGRFGRVAGVFALLAGLVGAFFVYAIYTGAKEGSAEAVVGVGIQVMFAASAIGALGGLIALILPDRGTVPPAPAS